MSADMSTSERPMMTKTEARAWLKRSREGLRWAEEALRSGDLVDLREALIEVTGAASQVQDAAEGYADYAGIRGMTTPEEES